MKPEDKPRIDHRYRILEGLGQGKEGICVDYKETSFGRNFAHIKTEDGDVFSKASQDIEPV